MLQMTKFRILLMAAFILIAGPIQAQDLSWKFETGDRFDIQMDQTTSVQTVVDRRVVEQTTQMGLTMTWQVVSKQDDLAVIRQTIDRVTVELTMPSEKGAETTLYDSAVEKPQGNAKRMAKSFGPILGQPIEVCISPSGQISKVEIPEATLESLRKMPGSVQGRKMFEEASVREMFSQAGLLLPEKEGENTWQTSREFKIGLPQTFRMTTDYSIVDGETNPVQITVNGSLELIEDTGKRPPELEFENIKLISQKSTGSVQFDKEAGNCVSSISETELKTRTRYRDMEVMATVNSDVKTTYSRTKRE